MWFYGTANVIRYCVSSWFPNGLLNFGTVLNLVAWSVEIEFIIEQKRTAMVILLLKNITVHVRTQVECSWFSVYSAFSNSFVQGNRCRRMLVVYENEITAICICKWYYNEIRVSPQQYPNEFIMRDCDNRIQGWQRSHRMKKKRKDHRHTDDNNAYLGARCPDKCT